MGLLDRLLNMFGSKSAQAPTAATKVAGAATAVAAGVATEASATAGAARTATESAAASAADPIRKAAMDLVGPGGSQLPALLEKLKAGGLREHVEVWTGTGDNMPVSPGGLTKALGADQIGAIAGRFGLPEEAVASGLAKVLPEIIDKLTPEGLVPDAADLKRHFEAQLK